MEEPTTFTTANVGTPMALAARRAAKLSAVSPDWEMTITRDPGPSSRFRYRNSLASSTRTGTSAMSSITYWAAMPTCQAEPQATISTLSTAESCSSETPTAERSIRPSWTRLFRVSRTALGCSWISLIMKCS